MIGLITTCVRWILLWPLFLVVTFLGYMLVHDVSTAIRGDLSSDMPLVRILLTAVAYFSSIWLIKSVAPACKRLTVLIATFLVVLLFGNTLYGWTGSRLWDVMLAVGSGCLVIALPDYDRLRGKASTEVDEVKLLVGMLRKIGSLWYLGLSLPGFSWLYIEGYERTESFVGDISLFEAMYGIARAVDDVYWYVLLATCVVGIVNIGFWSWDKWLSDLFGSSVSWLVSGPVEGSRRAFLRRELPSVARWVVLKWWVAALVWLAGVGAVALLFLLIVWVAAGVGVDAGVVFYTLAGFVIVRYVVYLFFCLGACVMLLTATRLWLYFRLQSKR